MKKDVVVPLFLLFVLLISFFACEGLDENYSTNPNDKLKFSVDTLAFDTVFTTVGSATKQFMIYNDNSEPLLLENVMLASGGSTGFRINVDGRKGFKFEDVRIQAHDSLYVFVEVTIDPKNSDLPLLVEDSVVFNYNGNKQSVRLEAYGQDVHMIRGGMTISRDTVLTSNKPYLIFDSLVVAEGAKVTIDPGTIFYLHDKANVIVYGTIQANGSQESPVVFRGDRLDYILTNVLTYDRAPSQWGGIYFRPQSLNNEFKYVIVRNGTTGVTLDDSGASVRKLTVSNSQITNMGQNLLDATNSNVLAVNSEFSNAGGAVVQFIGGTYQFIHCTLANYMTLVTRESPCLSMTNNYAGKSYSLSASFDNCIIDGSNDAGTTNYRGELFISAASGTTIDYKFNHCILKSSGSANEQFVSSIFTKTSPSYRKIGKTENKYEFDFRPDSLTSLGVGKADVTISKLYPIDRYGVSRLTGEGPDIGAYEFVTHEDDKNK